MALARLLRMAITQGIEPEYARQLLNIIEAEELQRQARKRQAASPQSDLLSERELEVLKLLEEEVSNEVIAVRLSVSLSTVKTHVHHIIEKLGVRDRSQAVFRGRELKLL